MCVNRVAWIFGICQKPETDPVGTVFLYRFRVYSNETQIGGVKIENWLNQGVDYRAEHNQTRDFNERTWS